MASGVGTAAMGMMKRRGVDDADATTTGNGGASRSALHAAVATE